MVEKGCGHQLPIVISGKHSFHLNIKYHMNVNVLVSGYNFSFPHLFRWSNFKFIECSTHIFHLFFNWLDPKVSPCFHVNVIDFLYCIGDTHPIPMGGMMVLFVFTFQIILSQRCSDSLKHQMKATSSFISFLTAYS